MGTIFRYALSKSRGAILGWGLGLLALGLLIVPIFDTIAEQADQIGQLMDIYPAEIFEFFGGLSDFSTPEGFLSIEYFSFLPIILGIYVISLASGLFASDEESGRLDLMVAHPLSRTAFFFGRVGALLVTLVAILTIGWLGLGLPSSAMESFSLGMGELVPPFLSLLAILLIFASLALLLSMILPSRRAASMVSVLLLVAGFFIEGLSGINADLEPLAKWLPLRYYQGGDAFNGLNWTWLGGLIGFSLLFILLAWWRFQRRDIRVAGEGSLPFLNRIRRVRRKNQRAAVR